MRSDNWLVLISLGCVALAGGAEADRGRGAAADRSALRLELLFEGDLADTSGSDRTCTARNAVTFAEGKRGQCASFDGSAWIDTGFLQEQLGSEFTVECWVNPGAQQTPHADIFGNHVGEGLGFVLQQDGSSINDFAVAYGAGAGRWVITDAVPLTAGCWQHVAFVKTAEELRFYVNGVLVADQQDPAPVRPSPMPVAVGLGYTAPERCFRGLIDDFRIWSRVLTDFGHAGIDPAVARETGSLRLNAVPRPAANALVQSWTVSSDDTRLTLGMTANGELVVSELSCTSTGRNFIARPVAFGFPQHVLVAGQSTPLEWRFRDANVDRSGRHQADTPFAADKPPLELTSQWHARDGPGPVRHRLSIRNGSNRTHQLSGPADLRPGPHRRLGPVVLPQRRYYAGSHRGVPASIDDSRRQRSPHGTNGSVRAIHTLRRVRFRPAAGGVPGTRVELLPHRNGRPGRSLESPTVRVRAGNCGGTTP